MSLRIVLSNMLERNAYRVDATLTRDMLDMTEANLINALVSALLEEFMKTHKQEILELFKTKEFQDALKAEVLRQSSAVIAKQMTVNF